MERFYTKCHLLSKLVMIVSCASTTPPPTKQQPSIDAIKQSKHRGVVIVIFWGGGLLCCSFMESFYTKGPRVSDTNNFRRGIIDSYQFAAAQTSTQYNWRTRKEFLETKAFCVVQSCICMESFFTQKATSVHDPCHYSGHH